MSGRVVVTGLDELIAALDKAPREIRTEGMAIVRDTTEAAATELRQEYGRKTGNLASRVGTTYPSTTLLVGIVRSAARHAHLYEFGTRQRRTSSGANRGAMPKADPQITSVVAPRHRRNMYDKLIQMLRGMGLFEVSES